MSLVLVLIELRKIIRKFENLVFLISLLQKRSFLTHCLVSLASFANVRLGRRALGAVG